MTKETANKVSHSHRHNFPKFGGPLPCMIKFMANLSYFDLERGREIRMAVANNIQMGLEEAHLWENRKENDSQ